MKLVLYFKCSSAQMSFLEFVVDNFIRDGYIFNAEKSVQVFRAYYEEKYQLLFSAGHPSRFHEARGKLCGYAFERGDLVYRCR
jgi:hypothetical protein